MRKLTIKNVGPLKEISISLNKVNVFIGPQSVGKSTLAKLISFCYWAEKDCLRNQQIDHLDWGFIERYLIRYYNLDGYFKENSSFEYIGEGIEISVVNKTVKVTKRPKFSEEGISKNTYIPSERNVLSIPSIFSVKLPDNYLLEFIDDWQEMRSKYKKDNAVGILDLSTEYYYNEDDNRDMVQLSTGENIRYSQSSSGLQSVIPLCVCIDYLTNWIYSHEEDKSAEERQHIRETLFRQYVARMIKESEAEKDTDQLREKLNQNKSAIQKSISNFIAHYNGKELTFEHLNEIPGMRQFTKVLKDLYNHIHPTYTNLVIEEPEQNLFPETQVQLVYYILSKIDKENRQDNLILTTHSPYILYALNNCLLAYLASQEDADTVRGASTVPETSWLNPEIVSVWELKEGLIREGKTIQDARGLVRKNYFEEIMHNVMADFSNMLSIL